MKKYLLPLAVPVMLVMAPAAAAQNNDAEIVVTTPAGLDAEKTEEWAKLNKQAAKLAKRLGKLNAEMQDDRNDVAEAKRALGKAQKTLKNEQSDMTKTAKNLAKAESEMQRIAARRDQLRSGN